MPSFRGVLLDAAGTLLKPAESVARVYERFSARYGGARSRSEIRAAFPRAMAERQPLRRADPSWKRFWRAVVADSTGVDSAALTDELYAFFAEPRAWAFAAGAPAFLAECDAQDTAVAIVSNWDVRLRHIVEPLAASHGLRAPALVVSGEEGVEKPEPEIFARACSRLGVQPHDTLMVGDSLRSDIEGALGAGWHAWLFGGEELPDFAALRRRLWGPSDGSDGG